MNNLFKSVGIWLVVALVLMTVFNQFNARQQSTAQAQLDYSQFLEEVKAGTHRQGDHRRPHAEGDHHRWQTHHQLCAQRHLAGFRPAQERREDRSQAGRRTILPDEYLCVVVPDAVADRRVDILHAPDAGRRQGRRCVLVRQEQGAHAG